MHPRQVSAATWELNYALSNISFASPRAISDSTVLSEIKAALLTSGNYNGSAVGRHALAAPACVLKSIPESIPTPC